jgi:glycerophosphoryl diester phosphodiesterase
VLLIAHRMPSRPAACRRLQKAGAELFEVDLQFDSRGLVVSHFAPVPRTDQRMHYDGWRLRVGRPDGREPLLAALLDILPDGARLLLDPKERQPERRDRLVELIVDAFPDPSRTVVSTGRREDLERLRGAGFETWRSIGDRAGLDRLLAAPELAEAGVTVRHTLLDAATVSRLHERTPRVVAWTVNRPARARQLADLGVDGITTDRPAVMAAVRRDRAA